MNKLIKLKLKRLLDRLMNFLVLIVNMVVKFQLGLNYIKKKKKMNLLLLLKILMKWNNFLKRFYASTPNYLTKIFLKKVDTIFF